MRHFLRSTLIALLLLAILEITLRVAFPEKIRNINTRGAIAYEFDPDYLMRLKKNVIKPYYRAPGNGGKKIIWSSNNQGFRGPELRPGAWPRIVVYGDSNIQARFSEEEDTYVRQLERALSTTLSEVEVINAGVIGFGPDQALIKFQKEVEALRPDIAIFNIFCDNDYGDLVRNRLFEIGPDGRLRPTSFARQPDNYLRLRAQQKQPFQLLVADFGRAFINRLFGEKEDPLKKEKMIDALWTLCAEEFETYRNNQPRATSHFRDHYDIDLAAAPESEAARVKTQLMEGIIREISRVGTKNNVRVIIQIQPAAIDLTRNHIVSYEDLASNLAYQRRHLTDIVEDICRRNAVEYLNLYDVFARQDPASCYFRDDDHWNDRGQRVAAVAMARKIRQ